MLEHLINVLIVDTGFLTEQKDIAPYVRTCEPEYSFHGTAVLSVILFGPDATNKEPLCDRVKISLCSVPVTKGSLDIVSYHNCLRDGANKNFDYVNLSLVGYVYDREEEVLIRKLTSWAKVYVAAGNDGVDIDRTKAYPASYTFNNLFTIGAFDYGKSNYGKHVRYETGTVIAIDKEEDIRARVGTSFSTAIALHKELMKQCNKGD